MPNREAEQTQPLAVLRKAISDRVADPRAYAQLGRTMLKSGDLAGAEQAFSKASEFDPEYRGQLAEVLHRQGRRKEAIALLRRAAEGSTNAHTHFLLGKFLNQSDDVSGAEKALRAAVKLEPSSRLFRNHLVGILNRKGMCPEALALLRPALEEGSPDASTYDLLGQILAQSKDLKSAEEAFRKAVALDPSSPIFHSHLANALIRQDRWDEARAIVRTVAANVNATDAYMLHWIGCQLLHVVQDMSGAEQAIRRAIELDRGVPEFRVSLAEYLRKAARFEEMLAVMTEVVAQQATSDKIHDLWHQAIARLGGLSGAERKLWQLVRTNPHDSAMHGALAEVLSRQGNTDAALALLLQFVRDETAEASVFAHIGRLRAARGNAAGAARAFRKAIELDPEISGYREALAELGDQAGAEPLETVQEFGPREAKSNPPPRRGFWARLRRLSGFAR